MKKGRNAKYDAVVVGAGIKGLLSAAFLARKGYRRRYPDAFLWRVSLREMITFLGVDSCLRSPRVERQDISIRELFRLASSKVWVADRSKGGTPRRAHGLVGTGAVTDQDGPFEESVDGEA